MNSLKPISLRVSLTNRCNMRCRYCRPSGEGNIALRKRELAPEAWLHRISCIASAVAIEKLRFTGGEPLLYSGLLDLVEGCAALQIPGLALTTNAIGLEQLASPLKDAGLERLNISLDSLDPDTFREITGRDLATVLAGILAAHAAGFSIKLNTVVQRGFNDHEAADLVAFAAEHDMHIRFLELMPIGPAASDFDTRYVSGSEVMENLSSEVQFEELWYKQGETSRDYRATLRSGKTVTCGFILPTSKPFCEGCRRLRLDPAGRLYGCLAQPDTFPLLKAFQVADGGDSELIRRTVRDALNIKKRPQAFRQQTAMIEIGG